MKPFLLYFVFLFLSIQLFSQTITEDERWICKGDSIEINEVYQSTEGIYLDTLVTASGGDSIIEYDLKLFDSYLYEYPKLNLCQYPIFHDNDTIRESGIYTYAYQTVNGCDSIYIYDISITNINTDVSIQGGEITALQKGGAYTWLDCSNDLPVEDAKSRSFRPERSGTYRALIILGACISTTDCYYINANLCSDYPSDQSTAICNGDSIFLEGSYRKTEGFYADTFPGIGGCDSVVRTHLELLPSYNINSEHNAICNSSLVLHETEISESGTYIFPFVSADGCDSIHTCLVEITNTNNTVSVNGGTISSMQVGAEYQWYNCDTNNPIDGANDQSFTPKEDGDYKVAFSFRACSDESECIHVMTSNIDITEYDAIQVYPNPGSGILQIKGLPGDVIRGRILDITGTAVLELNLNAPEISCNIRPLARGIYLIQLDTDHGTILRKIIKK